MGRDVTLDGAEIQAFVAVPLVTVADRAVERNETLLDADRHVAGVIVELGAGRAEGGEVLGFGVLPPVPLADEELAAGPHHARERAQRLTVAAECVRGSSAQGCIEEDTRIRSAQI